MWVHRWQNEHELKLSEQQERVAERQRRIREDEREEERRQRNLMRDHIFDGAPKRGKRTREQLKAEALALQQLIDNETDED